MICRNLYRICTKISDDTDYLKLGGNTDEEKLEQSILRQEYVDSIKRNMKAQLDSIEIERPDGTIEKLKPSYKKKK